MSYTPTVTEVENTEIKRFIANILIVMSLGIALTGAVAYWISHSPGMMQTMFHLTEVISNGKTKTEFGASKLWWFAIALELAIVLALSWGSLLKRLSVSSLLILFTVYAALNGFTLSPVIYAYTGASVSMVFFITAGTFALCAIFGYTTKINLLPLGTFFLISLIGLIIALVVNIFYHSPVMDFTISAAAVLLFAGLIAFDIQAMREIYYQSQKEDIPKMVMFGALKMYLDFINMFLHLLRLFGVKKD